MGRDGASYETIVKPVMLYGVFVLQRGCAKFTLAKKLERVQTAALIGICGALKTTLTLALNAILHIPPGDIAGKCIAPMFAKRLWDVGYMKTYKY